MEYTLERNDCDHATESYWAVLLDSVHTHPDIFESVTFSGFRIRLPSTRISGLRHTNPKLLESALWVEIVNKCMIRIAFWWMLSFLEARTDLGMFCHTGTTYSKTGRAKLVERHTA